MKKIYLTKLCVEGVKSLDKKIELSFYKKGIAKNINTQNYNIKGIYGMNGSGKSGIIMAVDILKAILLDSDYLNNHLVQKQLHEITNKKLQYILIEVDFLFEIDNELWLYYYFVKLCENDNGKYVINRESFYRKKATSRSEKSKCIFDIRDGEIIELNTNNKEVKNNVIDKTKNLLSLSSLSSLFFNIIKKLNETNKINDFYIQMIILSLFAGELLIYLEQQDIHENYLFHYASHELNFNDMKSIVNDINNLRKRTINTLTTQKIKVPIIMFDDFEKNVKQLQDFIAIFKNDLHEIIIEKKVDNDVYICQLIMNYGEYQINSEYESTGIKKLINLFVYLREAANGKIVFIDELDSNLHDIYLCAILEYLMSYGKGQLCFTTHNIGPMDILQRNKKSIDFLSMNHSIYSWKANGHYSPSKLYKLGMIEGSPFNIDAIDFIGILDLDIEE